MDFIIALFTNTYALMAIFALLLRYWVTNTYSYWKKQKIDFYQPVPFVGNFGAFFIGQKSMYEVLHYLYTYFGDKPYGGMFQLMEPQLLMKDPELIHSILVSDFKNFTDRKIQFLNKDRKLNPQNEHLIFAQGDRWRAMRRKISPIFTTGKLKSMQSQMEECFRKLDSVLDKNIQFNGGSAMSDVKPIFDRLTIDVISSCAFGIDSNSGDNNDEFRIMGNQVVRPDKTRFVFRTILTTIYKPLLSILGIADMSGQIVQFFKSITFNNIIFRRENNKTRPDLLQLLMDLQNAHHDPKYASPNQSHNTLGDERFDEIDIFANAFVFFLAGYETSATTLSLCIYELAIHQDIQEKVRLEVQEALEKCGGQLQYDDLKELALIDAVLMETLRKYPILPFLSRVAINDYPIPNSDVIIKKGTVITIPVYSIHHDWRYFPNPMEFRPDRFLGDNKHEIRNGTFMPFGDGPRNCIGSRFAKMEIKLALVELLSRYIITPTSKTQIPMNFIKGGVLMVPDEGVIVNISKRN